MEFKHIIMPIAVGSALTMGLACGGGGGSGGNEQSSNSLETFLLSAPSGESQVSNTSSGNLTPSERIQRQPLLSQPDVLDYVAYAKENLPAHFKSTAGPLGDVSQTNNTPLDNPITNEGAQLGRTLFYDRHLSLNRSVSCASCHQQKEGFSDRDRFSQGFNRERTRRHSPSLTNAIYYTRGRFFWDERAETLEAQVLLPIQNEIEMAMTLDALNERLSNLTYYAPLFTAAFGDATVTSDKISKALSQFVRSMVSYQSKFDRAFDGDGQPQFEQNLSEQERLGLNLFAGAPSQNGIGINCASCHSTVALIATDVKNIGLSRTDDDGAGASHFKVPSLRNVAVRRHFMHDGRFQNLRDVIDHYSDSILDDPNLSSELRGDDGQVLAPRYNREERDALLAFMETLTDEAFLRSPLFSDPFRLRDEKDRQKKERVNKERQNDSRN